MMFQDQAELKQKEQKLMIDGKIASEEINLKKAELAIDAKRQSVRDISAKRVEDNKIDLELVKLRQSMQQKPKGE